MPFDQIENNIKNFIEKDNYRGLSQYLIKLKAVDRLPNFQNADVDGNTLQHHAFLNRNPRAASLLWQYGAQDLKIKNGWGLSPLQISFSMNDIISKVAAEITKDHSKKEWAKPVSIRAIAGTKKAKRVIQSERVHKLQEQSASGAFTPPPHPTAPITSPSEGTLFPDHDVLFAERPSPKSFSARSVGELARFQFETLKMLISIEKEPALQDMLSKFLIECSEVLDNGVSIRDAYPNYTPLMCATFLNNLPVVASLVSFGFDDFHPDSTTETALSIALKFGRPSTKEEEASYFTIARELIERNATNVNQKFYNETEPASPIPLIIQLMACNVEPAAIQYLLDAQEFILIENENINPFKIFEDMSNIKQNSLKRCKEEYPESKEGKEAVKEEIKKIEGKFLSYHILISKHIENRAIEISAKLRILQAKLSELTLPTKGEKSKSSLIETKVETKEDPEKEKSDSQDIALKILKLMHTLGTFEKILYVQKDSLISAAVPVSERIREQSKELIKRIEEVLQWLSQTQSAFTSNGPLRLFIEFMDEGQHEKPFLYVLDKLLKQGREKARERVANPLVQKVTDPKSQRLTKGVRVLTAKHLDFLQAVPGKNPESSSDDHPRASGLYFRPVSRTSSLSPTRYPTPTVRTPSPSVLPHSGSRTPSQASPRTAQSSPVLAAQPSPDGLSGGAGLSAHSLDAAPMSAPVQQVESDTVQRTGSYGPPASGGSKAAGKVTNERQRFY